ncbi:hypothetical protein LX32DRAFT_250643 [Colletotrichum zoysiae]|uniref:Secreted protein n=1 Tax=Colletotrichum zoysiae TaxID=1216348 RepID=A0AAD9H4S8_9PEZI|nr:hypothetical protein LX32DRAFT_250643 [Colletotrichum zoysiae]
MALLVLIKHLIVVAVSSSGARLDIPFHMITCGDARVDVFSARVPTLKSHPPRTPVFLKSARAPRGKPADKAHLVARLWLCKESRPVAPAPSITTQQILFPSPTRQVGGSLHTTSHFNGGQ